MKDSRLTRLNSAVRAPNGRIKRFASTAVVGIWLSFGSMASAHADVVLELFTSHGCSSCPPAEALLIEMQAKHESLIALEYHVDYWNSLVHGNAGNFVDPFSQPGFSKRQRGYDAKPLKGRRGVYTPQAVVNGRYAMVGSNRTHVGAALKKSLPSDVLVTVQREADKWQIQVDNRSGNAASLKTNLLCSPPMSTLIRAWVARF